MSLFLLAAVLATILALAIMLIYLIGRVNALSTLQSGAGQPEGTSDHRFAGLDGRQLWELLVSTPDSAASAELQQAMRTAYAPVLTRHLEELFEEGRLDAQQGIQMPPRAPRVIRTTEGCVVSWLPAEAARAMYDIGRRSTRLAADSADMEELRQEAGEIARQLFQDCGLEGAPGFASSLMPDGAALLAPGDHAVPGTADIRPEEAMPIPPSLSPPPTPEPSATALPGIATAPKEPAHSVAG